MCESTIFLVRPGGEEKIMEDAIFIRSEGDNLLLTNLLGEQKLLPAKLRFADLLKHQIYLEQS